MTVFSFQRLCSICFLCSVLLSSSGLAQNRSSSNTSSPERSGLQAGATVQGELASGETQSYPLDAKAGDYIIGSIQGTGVRLSLWNAQEQRVRVLATLTGEQQELHILAGDEGPYSLKLESTTGGKYVLSLKSILSREDQGLPPDEPESPRLRQLNQTLADGGDPAAFWREVEQQGAPLVEREGVIPPLPQGQLLVTFLWRGNNQRVTLFAAPSGDHDPLTRLGTSDVWYGSYRVPSTARIGYKLAPDVPQVAGSFWERRRAILATVQRDPLNPNCFPENPIDKYEGESFIELPEAPPQPWLTPREGVVAGTIEQHRFSSEILKNTRNLFLYRPAGYQPETKGNGLLVLFDGDRYIDEVRAPLILDHLIAAGKIPPTAAILITNPSGPARSRELPCNPDFARFVSEEVMPWAKERGITADRTRTVVAGASYGGLAAAYMGLMHPELFGNVYSQSGSFWWSPGASPGTTATDPEWLPQTFAKSPLQPVRFYLEAGLFEETILTSTRHFRTVLQARGYDVEYHELASGHGFFYWRYTLPNGLIALLGPSAPAARQLE